MEQRETHCETFQNGQRSSQKISKIQTCSHPQTLLMIQMDSCSLSHDRASGDRCDQTQKGQSCSPVRKAQTQTDGKNHQKVQVSEEKVLLEKEAELRWKCANPSCNSWHHPVCQNYKCESWYKCGNYCAFRHTEAGRQPNKKSKKSSGKGSVTLLKESTQLGCVSQGYSPKKSISAESWEIETESHRQILQGHVAPQPSHKGRIPPHAKNDVFVCRWRGSRKGRAPGWVSLDHASDRQKKKRSMGHASTLFEKARGTRIRGKFRSIDAHAEQKRTPHQLNWKLFENPGNPQRWLQQMRKCKQVRKHRYTFTTLSSRWHACRPVIRKALRRTRLYLWVGQRSKSHIWPRMGIEFCARHKTSFLLFSQDCRQARARVRLLHRSRRTYRVPLQVQQDYEVTKATLRHRETNATKKKKGQQSGNEKSIERSPRVVIANTSRDSDSERSTKVAARKHGIKTHFPKDRSCEICTQTKITRAPCRRRTGEAAPRTENVGDLGTADHKVLNEGGESRNNHRYAVAVQDLATQWIQSFPCNTKTSQETSRSLRMFFEPS